VVSSTEDTKKKPRAARRASAAKRIAASSDSDNDSYNGSYDIKEIQKRDRMLRNRESAALSRSVLFFRAPQLPFCCSCAVLFSAAAFNRQHLAPAEDLTVLLRCLFIFTGRESARRQSH
jgi:hypothetical protein